MAFFNVKTEKKILDFSSPYFLSISKSSFCEIKTRNLYKKILHRCFSRSEGASDENKILSLFDSNEKSGAPRGLISILSKAMEEKKQIAIIYEAGVVRIANSEESETIKKDYLATAKSNLGILVDFTKYETTDLVKTYMSMIYDTLSSMNTQVGLAKALQMKFNNLRSTVSVNAKDEPINQASEMNKALKRGESILLDKNDEVQTLTINSESVKSAMTLIYSQLCTEIGMPLSFVTGELTSGMSATGEADTNQQEEGLQDFFNSIFKPACDRLYGWKLRFVSDDWRYFSSMIQSLIVVENSSLLTEEQKRAFAERLMPISR